jgi:hypothetical protein
MHRNKTLFNQAIGKRKQRRGWRHRSGAFTSSSDGREKELGDFYSLCVAQ